MIVNQLVVDGGMQRRASPGDLIAGAETFAALATAGAGTLTAALLVAGLITRTGPTAGYTDTTDTATNIINAMVGNYNYTTAGTVGKPSGNAVQPGTTFRISFINTVAYLMTLAAGTGVTLGSNVNCAASSVKDYLITVTNGTPQQVFAATTTNGSAVVTGLNMFQTSQLSIGQLVTGSGVSGNIISITPGQSVTLSANASATASNVAITFSPTVRIDSLGAKLL